MAIKSYKFFMIIVLLAVTGVMAATPAMAEPALSEAVFYVH